MYKSDICGCSSSERKNVSVRIHELGKYISVD